MTKKLKMLIAAVLVMTAVLGISGTAKAEEPVVGCASYDDSTTCTGEGGGGAYDPSGNGSEGGNSYPDYPDGATCYDQCVQNDPTSSDPNRNQLFCFSSCLGGDTSVNTPNGPKQPIVNRVF